LSIYTFPRLILQPSRLPECSQAPSLFYDQLQHMLIRLFRPGQDGSSKYRGQSKGIYTKDAYNFNYYFHPILPSSLS